MIQIVVLIYAGDDGVNGIRNYESLVIPILREHSGVLVSASSHSARDESEPDEIHIIQFPSLDRFNAYKNDGRVVALANRRNRNIGKTQVYFTDEFHEYR